MYGGARVQHGCKRCDFGRTSCGPLMTRAHLVQQNDGVRYHHYHYY